MYNRATEFKKNFIVLLILLQSTSLHAALSSLSKNDPYPVFTAQDPHDFLYTRAKLKLKEPEYAQYKFDRFGIGVSPFAQNANKGTDYKGDHFFPNVATPPPVPIEVELGDLVGRWSMVALLFGPIPQGRTLPPLLLNALNVLFPGMPPGSINDPTQIDPNQELGFFSIPMRYRKRGVRFDMSANIMCGFGLNLQAGVASMSQTVTAFVDLTCIPISGCPFVFTETTRTNIENTLMKDCLLHEIAHQIGVNLRNYDVVSVDEIRLNLFWRQAYELNKDMPHWPHVLVMPFFELSTSFSPGKTATTSHAFAAPFGNNGHTAVGFTAGMEFDFLDTIEIGAEVAVTHFFPRDFCNYRVPTSPCQIGIFPFATDVTVKPGLNWNFTAQMAAYHFLQNLSFYFQYVMVEHKKDEILLRCPDPAFLPEKAEQITNWKVKLANISMMYDISPNIGLGVLWQAPLSQRNAYQSTTIMLSFYATY